MPRAQSPPHPPPNPLALTAAPQIGKKRRLRERGVKGQTRVKKWVVLDLGVPPDPSYDPWGAPAAFRLLACTGEACAAFTLRDLRALPDQREYGPLDWHCVTGWTAPGLRFRGVPLRAFIAKCGPPADWVWLKQTSADGYTTVVHREDAEDPASFLCLGDAEGELLAREHGGVRLVFPQLFGWKSAKWLVKVEFLSGPAPGGFWEKLGCHARGRVALDERWAPGRTRGVWTLLVGSAGRPGIMQGLYMRYLPAGVWTRIMQLGGAVLGFFTLGRRKGD